MKTLITHSPKTAGNTIISTNIALAYQVVAPHLRVGFLQLSGFPDLEHYLPIENPKNLGDLLAFQGSPEWQANLLPQITAPAGIDFYFSPPKPLWSEFRVEVFKTVWQWFEAHYDVLFVDVGRQCPEAIESFVWSTHPTTILCSTVDPISLGAIRQFGTEHSVFKNKTHLLINQCPQEALKNVQQKIEGLKINLLGVLPFDQDSVWHQVYEGFPVVSQKRSKLKKSIEALMPKILNL